MSIQLHQSMRNGQQCIIKDDSVVQPDTWYKYIEVRRWDVEIRQLWPNSKFINCWDSISDPNCPNNIDYAGCFEYVEVDDYKSGSKYELRYGIQGVTKDSAGDPLGGCIVDLFRTSDDLKVDTVVSDAAGNYLLHTPYLTEAHYCVAYKALAPDVTGATVNTLIPQA